MSRNENNTGETLKEQRQKPIKVGGRGGPGGFSPGEKAKDFKKAWGQLLLYCKEHLALIIIAIVLASAGVVFTIIGPNKIGELTNIITVGLVSGIDMDSVMDIAVLLAVLYGMGAVFSYIQGFIMTTVTQRISKSLRGNISVKINKLPLKYFDSSSYGDILSRVTNDVDTIGQTLSQSIISLITSVLLLLGVLMMMFITNWIMAVAAIGASVVGFGLMVLIMSKSQKYFTAQQKSLGDMNGHVEEIYSGHNVVKVYNGAAAAKAEQRRINNKLYESAWKSQFMSGLMMPLMGFIGNFGFVAVCVTGGVLAINGSIDMGIIVSFMLYVRLFMQPLSQIAQAATSLQSTAAASERVFEFLSEEELADESAKAAKPVLAKGRVEFEHVTFGYSENRTIIKDFSAVALPGQKIAIVGPTGAGKTTMVNLLMRFYELNSGEIKIDGIKISELTRGEVHGLFSMVLQDTWIFEGTVMENIVYSQQNVTKEQVVAACKAAELDHFIRTLPHGYDTMLDDNTSLSVGQRQLLTIARAMVKDAPMLILDEATSSVDTRTEVLIQRAMDKLMQGRTSFVIAHRLSTIRNADLILVMRDGGIAEQGTHAELIDQSGFYADLYNSQFENAE